MAQNRSPLVIIAVILLALFTLKDIAEAAPRVSCWAGPDSVNVTYLAHMARLRTRLILAELNSVISFS